MRKKINKTIPLEFLKVLPEDYKKIKYRKVRENMYFGVHKGYSYQVEKHGNVLKLTRCGMSETGNWGIGNIAQGFKKEKKGIETSEVTLNNK